ncbi:homoserine dehydrogenase [Variovorax sp. J22P168]|uniref:homoserine dehydrogenase n=1 Tax=Variovorax jilinensis TaxID=3053513 RepID=UPI002575D8AB|nr:homoserine dehydrogenase [Variovorax sp. J22P168]MDM0015659.1 homoserine dehydrogenase [Variovorax sp. J22P168]
MYREPVSSLQPLHVLPPAIARPLRVGMIGIGTVGSGTFRVLARNQAEIAGRAGRGIEIVIVAARNLARAAAIVGTGVALCDDPMTVATHPDVDVVVEVAGGCDPALGWVLAAIAQGKHVITANKALLALHGEQIFAAARAQGVAVAYEAAVAVSIPIVKALREGLTANRIEWVAGIVNGTTNFILSKMRDEGVGFAAALAEAQALGYAEADPAFDVDGIDAAHKIALLAATAFGTPVRFDDVQVEGIAALQRADVAGAEQLGFRIKLLAIARRREDGMELRVQPALLAADQLMANVNGAMNAVMVAADAAGLTMYYGAGAGSEQTASAVIADLVDVARLEGTKPSQRVPHQGFHCAAMRPLPVLPRGEVHCPHYLRLPLRAEMTVEAIAELLHSIGLTPKRVLSADTARPAALVLTAPTLQAELDAAVRALQVHPAVDGTVVALRVESLGG